MKHYIITGAAGHLARAIISRLEETDCRIDGLILPGEPKDDSHKVTYHVGDVTDPLSLEGIFEKADSETVVIHTAGIISIADKVSPAVYRVNVEGTDNIIRLCLSTGVKRLVYVSSVHAIPELPKGQVMSEISHFDADSVWGGYAKTKAQATANVLASVEKGLDAVVVHPSGIIGPGDKGGNHVNQFIRDSITGKLPVGIKGGYDFVDVRDVAKGCIAAAHMGRKGECYILSNKYYTVAQLLEYIRVLTGGRKKLCVASWLVRLAVPFIVGYARLTGQRPLITNYSLSTLTGNSLFSCEKAARELGYTTRDMGETIKDTVKEVTGLS